LEIVVNTRLLIKNKLEGIGWFTFETMKRITQQHPEHHFIFLFDREFDEEFIFADNITPLILSPPARHPFLFVWWFELSVANFLNKFKPDLFLSPDGYLSLRANCKQLAVMHDLNFEHYPNDLPFLVRKYYRYYFPRFAKKATRIATVSEFSKQDIIKQYGIDKNKIDVVYNGCNSLFKPISEEQKANTRKLYTSDKEYFVFVGALHPRKNISRLLLAFDKLKSEEKGETKLVIVGEKYYWTKEIKMTYISMKHKQDVVFTGRLNSKDLKNVIASAIAMVYVPYFEGFGIPIIEAFNCGTAVITSNVTSMPEVAANAALLVNPLSIDEICGAMKFLEKDEEYRQELINKGTQRAKDFSWDRTAAKLWEIIVKTSKSENL
jgi:glycosyltransferase involved in cell wall biosynthesis